MKDLWTICAGAFIFVCAFLLMLMAIAFIGCSVNFTPLDMIKKHISVDVKTNATIEPTIRIASSRSQVAAISPPLLRIELVCVPTTNPVIQLEPADSSSWVTRTPTNWWMATYTNFWAEAFAGRCAKLSWPLLASPVVVQTSLDMTNWLDIRVWQSGTTNWLVRFCDPLRFFRLRVVVNAPQSTLASEGSYMPQNEYGQPINEHVGP